MPFNVKAAGVWQAVAKVHARVAGAWLNAQQVWGYAAGGWRSAWQNEIRYINTSARTGASIFELMGSPTEAGDYVFENQAVISAGTGSYALRTGVFPAGSTLTIVNKGYIRGRGGNGGAYNTAGDAGSTALYVDYPCTVDNAAGYIYGGGGGGGGAYDYNANNYYRSGGGGGAGSSAGTVSSSTSSDGAASKVQPVAGTVSGGGAGGSVTINGYTVYGGNGGGLGAAGATGVAFTYSGFTKAAFAGGAAGAAITKNGKVVTITAGNDTTRIKGAVA